MKEKETINTIVKCKIDVLGILKNMELEEQEELIDWIIEKISNHTQKPIVSGIISGWNISKINLTKKDC